MKENEFDIYLFTKCVQTVNQKKYLLLYKILEVLYVIIDKIRNVLINFLLYILWLL